MDCRHVVIDQGIGGFGDVGMTGQDVLVGDGTGQFQVGV